MGCGGTKIKPNEAPTRAHRNSLHIAKEKSGDISPGGPSGLFSPKAGGKPRKDENTDSPNGSSDSTPRKHKNSIMIHKQNSQGGKTPKGSKVRNEDDDSEATTPLSQRDSPAR